MRLAGAQRNSIPTDSKSIVWLDEGKSLALLVQVLARANSKPICSRLRQAGAGLRYPAAEIV